jgi:hypothetical protein
MDLKQCRSTACHYRPQQSTKMANAVAQVGPWVKFTVAKSSRKSCWVRSPQKITVVAGLKSGRKVIIVTTIVLSGMVVSSTKLTNPSDAKDGAAGSERPLEATSTTAEQADEKHGHDTSHGAPPKKLTLPHYHFIRSGRQSELDAAFLVQSQGSGQIQIGDLNFFCPGTAGPIVRFRVQPITPNPPEGGRTRSRWTLTWTGRVGRCMTRICPARPGGKAAAAKRTAIAGTRCI